AGRNGARVPVVRRKGCSPRERYRRLTADGRQGLVMANTTDAVSAIRELTNTNQLERGELIDLLKDGLHAALVKRYGPNVRSEIGIDEMKWSILIVVLKIAVDAVDHPGTQVTSEA